MKRFSWMIGALFLSTLASQQARASDIDSARMMSIGAGIASPSKTTALVENPAGLSLNEKTRLLGVLASDNDNLNPLDYGGGIFFGNGSVGAAGQITRVGGAATDLDLGLGVLISQLDMSFGAAFEHDLSASGSGWSTNLGAIFNTKGKWRIGAEVRDAFNGPSGFGLGFATDLTQDVTFDVDGSTDKDFKGLHVKPTLAIDVHVFQIAFGYGIQVDKNSSSFINTGFALALAFKLSDAAYLQFYYNQIEKYYLGVTFRL
jgi:hypothetical protein